MCRYSEFVLRNMCANYLKIAHKGIVYRFDLAADMKLDRKEAARNKEINGRWSRGYPDLFIAYPNGKYAGLFIELKVVSPFKKNGDLKSSEHLKRQSMMLEKLRQLGYMATFATCFDEFKEIVDTYIGKRNV